MHLTSSTFQGLREHIQRLCGLVLSDDKEYLVRDRLGPLLRQRHLKGFDELLARMASGGDPALADAVINAMTTQETSFFRDPQVYEALAAHVLPQLLEVANSRRTTVRIWSAGTSTGQEAYSLAILAQEQPRGPSPTQSPGNGVEILGTDISSMALGTATKGVYHAREVARGLSPLRQQRFFDQRGEFHHARESLRGMVHFRRLNLTGSLAGLGPFDLICCRNVLIYFDVPTRRRFCEQCRSLLSDHGWLLLGAAENLYGISDAFVSTPLGTSSLIYQKV